MRAVSALRVLKSQLRGSFRDIVRHSCHGSVFLVRTCTSPEHTHAHRHTNTHAYTHTQTHTEKEEISQIKLPSSCVLIFSFFFSRSQRVPSGCLYFHVLVAYSRNGFQVVSLKGAKSSRASCSGEIFKWLMLDGVTRRRRGEKKSHRRLLKGNGLYLLVSLP